MLLVYNITLLIYALFFALIFSNINIFYLFVLEWSGEVRSINYSADAKSVSVVYRVTLYGTDAEVLNSLFLSLK